MSTHQDCAAQGWREVDVSRHRVLVALGARAFVKGPVRAIRSQDEGRWHLSVSCADRLPTWGEMGEARDALLPPDVFLCIPHPPRKYWVNDHPYTLHFFEIRDATLVRMWRLDGEAARARGVNVPTSGEEVAR